MIMIFARKIYKIPEFYMIFARILHKNCPKNNFPRILGGMCPPCPRLLRLRLMPFTSTTLNNIYHDTLRHK